MEDVKFSLDSLEESTGPAPEPQTEKTTLTAIFKVKRPGYIPPHVTLRARVSESLFTGSFAATDLRRLRQDRSIVSVEVAHRLPSLRKKAG